MVNVEHDKTRSTDVQEEAVVGAGEPTLKRVGVTTRLVLPAVAEHRSRMLARGDGTEIEASLGIFESRLQFRAVGIEIRDA